MKRFTLLAVWILCGYINWGLTLGWFTHQFPEQDHVDIATRMALFGPIGLPAVALSGRPYHWQVKPYTTEQRWVEFNKRYPELGRDYFDERY